MDHAKLEYLAAEFEQSAIDKEIEVRGTAPNDLNRDRMIVELKNLQRWAKTIREALK